MLLKLLLKYHLKGRVTNAKNPFCSIAKTYKICESFSFLNMLQNILPSSFGEIFRLFAPVYAKIGRQKQVGKKIQTLPKDPQVPIKVLFVRDLQH